MTGEAALDRRGLLIDDNSKRWRLRLGDIRPELLVDAALTEDRLLFENLARSPPLWGVRWEVRF